MKTTVLFLLFSLSLTAQIKGLVVDENDKPISYANIWFENGAIATTSEENGTFYLEIKNNEKALLFSALGFETKTVEVTKVEKVVLKSVAFELDEVLIKPSNVKQKKEIGYYESSGFRYHMNYFVNALFFNPSAEDKENYPFIKEIKFKTLSEVKNAKIRLYLVERNEQGAPSENRLCEEVIFEVKKGNSKNIIDFTDKKIAIPEEGFFVVFEKLKIEQNKHFETYTIKDTNGNKTKHKAMSYQPEIPLAPVKDAVGWNKRTNNKWEKSSKTILKNPNSYENILMKKYHDKYLVPAVNVTLTN